MIGEVGSKGTARVRKGVEHIRKSLQARRGGGGWWQVKNVFYTKDVSHYERQNDFLFVLYYVPNYSPYYVPNYSPYYLPYLKHTASNFPTRYEVLAQ